MHTTVYADTPPKYNRDYIRLHTRLSHNTHTILLLLNWTCICCVYIMCSDVLY